MYQMAMSLVSLGVAYNDAMDMPYSELVAAFVTLNEMPNGFKNRLQYNWDTNEWSKVE